ncbi:hypothetical protein [Streptomyces sp. NRRL WC-3742]|uniref:hypothetical protein n=1 Tax=Streptomyces sp. NRRL WC-3742 TaxID=1463934 RepID=UPI0004C52F56|nr:hypothetical protein [Streptomyces sp. NRRL WC-3742]
MRTRQLLTALAVATAAVLPAAAPAGAHGDTVHLEVSGVDNGHVSAVATWENDHDPVTDGFAGTLSATAADGRTAGPWRLVAVQGRPGTYTTRELLPAGHWKVTVDCAFPSLGHGERELDVEAAVITDPAPSASSAAPAPSSSASSAAPAPASSAPSVPAVSETPAAPAAPAEETKDDTSTWAVVGTAAALVGALGAVGFVLRRRSRR